jgi:UDP-glucuronate decarboxylase
MESEASLVGPVNLGNPEEFTIGALADKVRGLAGLRGSIAYRPLPADDPKQRCPDISLAKLKLDWQPRVGLDQGLKSTFDYFRQALSGDDLSPRPDRLPPV